jgi:hypothetical protein
MRAADDERAPALEVSMLMTIMPILCSRVSAGISHNIAQERQEESVVGEQNNTCAPAWRTRECAARQSSTLNGATLPAMPAECCQSSQLTETYSVRSNSLNLHSSAGFERGIADKKGSRLVQIGGGYADVAR